MTPRHTSTSDILIQVPSLRRAVAFYEGAVGWKPRWHGERLVEFRTGRFTLYVEQARRRRGPILELTTTGRTAGQRRLVAAGCKVVRSEGPHHWLQDPFGLTFNLRER